MGGAQENELSAQVDGGRHVTASKAFGPRWFFAGACLIAGACDDGDGDILDLRDSKTQQAVVFGGDCPQSANAAGALLFDGVLRFPLGEVEGPTVLCSAVLVTPDVALTAAHCADPHALGAIDVQTDALAVSFNADVRPVYDNAAPFPDDAVAVVDTIIAPDFDVDTFLSASGGLGQQHDWALLLLEAPVAVDVAEAVTVWTPDDGLLSVGLGVDVVGHGTTDGEGAVPGEQSTGRRRCGFSFINALGAFEVQVGAGSQSVRRCEVDSGGPTFATVDGTPLLLGLGSRGFVSDCSDGAIDTRIDAIVDDINLQLETACDDKRRTDCSQVTLKRRPPPIDVDAGFPDAGFPDAGFPDAGFPDAGFDDAGFDDDAGTSDPDAGDEDGDDVDDPGCACTQTTASSSLSSSCAWALAAIGWASWRRRRRRHSP